MKHIAVTIVAIVFPWSALSAADVADVAPAASPNIVLILSDDQA